MYIVTAVTSEGSVAYGPFKDFDEADLYAETHLSDYAYEVLKVLAPLPS